MLVKRTVARILIPLLLIGAVIAVAPSIVRQTAKALYPNPYWETVHQEAVKHGVEPSLVLAVIRTESFFKPKAVSSAGARGLMQITPVTLKWAQYRSEELRHLTDEDLFDAKTNIRVGVYILSLLTEQFSNTETVLAAYNAGAGAVSDWLADTAYSDDGDTLHTIPYSETKQYVKKVTAARRQYQKIYNF